MSTATLTKLYSTWVQRGTGSTIYSNASGGNAVGDNDYFVGRNTVGYTNDFYAAVVAFSVPSITDATTGRTVAIPFTAVHDYGTVTSLYAQLSTTAPSNYTSFNNGPKSGSISNEITWNQNTTSLSFALNNSTSIGGKTIYLYLYAKSDASLYTVTVTEPGNGTLSYSCSHSSVSYGGTASVHTKCNTCGATVSSIHSYTTTITKAATCTASGTNTHKCACGYSYTSAIDALGHSPGADATCTTPQTCTRCGATLANATGHNYVDTVVAPTCTVRGYTSHTCSRCGDSYTDSYVNATGHSVNASGTCTKCGEVIQEVHTHSYTISVIAPTCTDRGYTLHKCSCGDSYTDNYTNALGHSAGAAATCTTPQTCTRCGAVLKYALGHSYVGSVTTEPTFTSEGEMTYTCTRCDASYTTVIPRKPGGIFVSDGVGFNAYRAHIDNGSSWKTYVIYVDNGSKWEIYA